MVGQASNHDDFVVLPVWRARSWQHFRTAVLHWRQTRQRFPRAAHLRCRTGSPHPQHPRVRHGATGVIARREDRTVIGGHQRLLAARRLGLKKVPVVFVDLSREQARLLNLALNRISGEWDQELLARLLADLQQVPDLDLSLSGFADDELRKLLRSLDDREKRERPETFDLAAALEAATSVPLVSGCTARPR